MGRLFAGERDRPKSAVGGRWHDSPSERRLRAAAHHYRLPRSVILGRIVGPLQPLWTADDLEAALEYQDYLDSLCSGCGRPKDVCMDPAMSGRFEAVPLQCFACAPKDAEMRRASESKDDYGAAAFDGIYIAVVDKG